MTVAALIRRLLFRRAATLAQKLIALHIATATPWRVK